MLKAQAVLVATKIFLLSSDATTGDSTEQQAYLGAQYERPAVKRGSGSSLGAGILVTRMIRRKSISIPLVVAKQARLRAVFGRPARNMPYLRCVPCQFCAQSPFYKQTTTLLPNSTFEALFGELPQIDKYDCAGRPQLLTLHKNGRQTDMSGYQFWLAVGQKFGWDKLPGTRFQAYSRATICENAIDRCRARCRHVSMGRRSTSQARQILPADSAILLSRH